MGVKQAIKILNQRKEEQQRQIAPIKTENPRGAIANEFKNFMMQTANNINNTTRNSIEVLKNRQNQTTEQDNKRLIAPVGKNTEITSNNDFIKNIFSQNATSTIENPLKKMENLKDIRSIEKEKGNFREIPTQYESLTNKMQNTIDEFSEASTEDKLEDLKGMGSTVIHSAPLAVQNILHGIGQFEHSFEKTQMKGLQRQNEINRALGRDEIEPGIINAVLDKTGIESNRQWQTEKIAKNESDMHTKLGKWINQQIPSITQNLTNTAVSAIAAIPTGGIPAMVNVLAGGVPPIQSILAGGASFAASAFGGYYDDAIASGLTEQQAFSKAGIMSSFEFISEGIVTTKTLSRVKKVANAISKKSTEELLEQGTKGLIREIIGEVGENFAQEAIMDPLEVIVDKYVKNEDIRLSDIFNEDVLKQAINDGIAGAFSSLLLFGFGAGIGKATQITNKITNKEKIKMQDIIELEKASREAGLDTKAVIRENSEAIAERIIENTKQNKNQNEKDIKELLNERIDNNKIAQATENRMIAPVREIEQAINNIIPKVEQTTRATAEVYKNAFKSDTERERIVTQLEAIQSTRNKYNKNGTLNIVFDSTVNGNGVLISDKQGNRTIKLNPKTDKAAEFVLIHELTHDLKGSKAFTELSELVQSFNNKQFNFEDALESIKNTYEEFYKRNNLDMSDLDTKEEAIADILGTALGNQEFVNQLAQKPTVFQRIKNWIGKIEIHKSNDKEFTRWLYNVQDTFKKAIKENSNVNTNGTKYSIQTDNKGDKYVKVDTDQHIFENVNENEYTKIAKEYILSKFRDGSKKINLPTMEDVNVTSNTAREYTHPKNKLAVETKKTKMKASTELDNIIKISEYKYSRPDDGRHKIAKDGWDYYKTVFEVDGKKFEGLVNIAKSGNKKTLYDITKIKELAEPYSTSDKSFSVSSTNSNNSITSTEAEVNTTNSNSTQENKKYSQEFKDKWKEYLDFIDKKVTETKGKQEKTFFNEKLVPTAENVYNKVEVNNNEQINRRNAGTSRVFKNSESKQSRNYNKEEYRKWESSIKPIKKNELTDQERQYIKVAKKEYNKNIVLYDELKNDNTYSAGASQITRNKIIISKQKADTFGLNKMIYHEVAESDIIYNEKARDLLEPTINIITQDNNFTKQKKEFWKNENSNIPTDRLIAKDVLCDRFSEIITGEKIDYNNMLSNATNSIIDNALINYYKEIYNKELEIPSSFNLSENGKKKQ